MQKTKKKYEAPALTTVTFKTERGYASSNLVQSIWIGTWVGSGDPGNTNGLENYGTGSQTW